MTGDAKGDHAHPLRLLAFALLAIVLASGWAWSVPAHADEALLPDEADGAQEEVDDADPTDMGVAPIGAEPRGKTLSSALDAYLDQVFPSSGVPGAAVAVVDSDGVRYLRTLGDVTSADQTLIIGSLSKSMASAAVQQLLDAGAVCLDAPVDDYLPAYGVPRSVTVRDLLNQTSGFGYYQSLADARVGESYGEFSYANANYDLLGRLVEGVSGLSYGDYLRKNLWGPLGMVDACLDGEKLTATRGNGRGGGEATGHRNWFGLSVADGFVHERGDGAWGGPASGYVRASINDMASYLRMYLNSGAGVVSRAGVHRMVFDRVPDASGDTCYGMGWTTYSWGDGELVMSHDGDVENYVARMCVIPGRDLGIVLLADANDAVGGNAAFWQMADDVTSLAVGGVAVGVNPGETCVAHSCYDAAYLLAILACVAPVLLTRRWAGRMAAADAPERAVRAAWAVALHVAVPACVALVPAGFGMRLRDFADFYPEQALVMAICDVLLVAGGAMKMASLGRARGGQGGAAAFGGDVPSRAGATCR
ncbi:serine hydrolase domain-containing protein [Paratractidigestivibacter faecalis]|uniref:serine hydrolase domain-containing protein n=1 Tax=Paratractidigestivibacter faecalis TaxID=2292441 RepID=UPI003A92E297